jgi:hypothetical protein
MFGKHNRVTKAGFLSICTVSALILFSCNNNRNQKSGEGSSADFPPEMVSFTPYENNPVFTGTGTDTWDRKIRERGYILHEDGIYKMWYTGYKDKDTDPKYLGYATSDDGIHWVRYPGNPIFDKKWTEDVFVMKYEDTYYMYAEGKNDVAHLLTSSDGINWEEQGDLRMHMQNGDSIPGPYGTPTLWIENGHWYLFYERNDNGIWLAESKDHITWTNLQDDPVIKKGPEPYDAGALAANQVVKFQGKYYLYYHGSTNPDWMDPNSNALWTSNVAMSEDLFHWTKYPGNPIVEGDHSSPILVNDGNQYRLYTMHDKVWLYFPKEIK